MIVRYQLDSVYESPYPSGRVRPQGLKILVYPPLHISAKFSTWCALPGLVGIVCKWARGPTGIAARTAFARAFLKFLGTMRELKSKNIDPVEYRRLRAL